ncbi:MAG: DL-methionine transporter permease subunit, partial [Tannerella sp.]|nr:DL-methionine transporter permease subunit [Tannerella sp.]
MIDLFLKGIWETLIMTFGAGFLGFAAGLPMGILLYTSRSGGIGQNSVIYGSLSAFVNVFRAIPF